MRYRTPPVEKTSTANEAIQDAFDNLLQVVHTVNAVVARNESSAFDAPVELDDAKSGLGGSDA